MFSKTGISIAIILAIAFSQSMYKTGGVARLSPRLLNYQGYLTDTQGNPVSDSLDVVVRIYAVASGGTPLWTETQIEVPIEKGIFNLILGSVTPLPDSIFTRSASRWLELRVASQTLSPRTQITAAGYAFTSTYSDTAEYARSAPATADNDWAYRITDGADTTLQMGGCWGLTRAGNTLYGNADSTHVNLGAACTTGTSGQNYQYCAVTGGYRNKAINNFATVGGGFLNMANGPAAVVGGGYNNCAESVTTFIGGGYSNTARGWDAVIGGGRFDTTNATYGAVLGGYSNLAGDATTDTGTVVVGGYNNTAAGRYSFLGGGVNNSSIGYWTTLNGGADNLANGDYATVGGGNYNFADNDNATVGGGKNNYVYGESSTIGGGVSNEAGGSLATISGGGDNCTGNDYATVGGGYGNTAGGISASIGGGTTNNVAGDYSSIVGGYFNAIAATGDYSYLFGINSNLSQDSTFMVDMPHTWFGTEAAGYEFPRARGVNGQVMITDGSGQLSWGSVAGSDNDWVRGAGSLDTVLFTANYLGLARGGASNVIYGDSGHTVTNFGVACTTSRSGESHLYSTIGGGYGNCAEGNYSVISGGQGNKTWANLGTICGGFDNQVEYSGTVAGGYNNHASGMYAAIGGGLSNYASGSNATIAGGYCDTVSGDFATVGGGNHNVASNFIATVGGGGLNKASGSQSTIGGGSTNTASGLSTTIAGGVNNLSSGMGAFIGGGTTNNAGGDYSVIAGGYLNTITTAGDYSYLFGINSNLTQDSTFMVDMPHTWFGTEAVGYEFPRSRGTNGQVMITDGSGKLSWGTITGSDNDWVIAGSNMYSNVSGHVGIGTTNPGVELDVDGDGRFTGSVDIAGGLDVYGDITSQNQITGYGFGCVGNMDVTNDGHIAGMLGVGTGSPTAKLEITGMGSGLALKIIGSGSACHFYNDANGTHIKSYDTTNARAFYFHTGNDWTPEMYLSSAGNLGLGTTNPTTKLYVNGSGRFDGNVNIYYGGLDVEGNITSMDHVTCFGFACTGNADVTNDAHVMGRLGVNTATPASEVDINGATGYGQFRMRTTYTPSGTSDPNGNVGDVAWDADYVYVKTAAGWKRSALTTW